MARSAQEAKRVAVVLFNLGGPDRLSAVRPFLFRLFSDPAIIQAPAGLRHALAALISGLRARAARANYAIMGGASPLLAQTQAQADALQCELSRRSTADVKAFVAMRYWPPLSADAARAVEAFAPDEVMLLPLYPQFSTTTTASSLKAWAKAYRGPGRVRTICCYPTDQGLVDAHARRIETAWVEAGRPPRTRLLFSAHGLPEKIVEGGDPYRAQIEATAGAVAARLGDGWDWRVCYQSRVGPLKWLGPSTVEAIEEATREGLGVIVAPIAFVSEHVETLVELDHDYAALAAKAGCPHYIRVPTLGLEDAFIGGLAEMVTRNLVGAAGLGPGSGFRCDGCWSACPALALERAA